MNLHPLQIAAHSLADSLNVRVVMAAFAEWGRQGVVCKACEYMGNEARFQSALYQYTIWRIRYFRIHSGSMKDAKASWGGIENAYFQVLTFNGILTQFWPCPHCVARFNPTGRKKQRYGNRRRSRHW